MKKLAFYLVAALALGSFVACSEKDVVDIVQNANTDAQNDNGIPGATPQESGSLRFVSMEEWLYNSIWEAQPAQYNRYIGHLNWRQFRTEYDPQAYYEMQPAIHSTFQFVGDSIVNIYSRDIHRSAFELREDSLVYITALPPTVRLYQISADSMIVCDWNTGFTHVIEGWLFTKVQ